MAKRDVNESSEEEEFLDQDVRDSNEKDTIYQPTYKKLPELKDPESARKKFEDLFTISLKAGGQLGEAEQGLECLQERYRSSIEAQEKGECLTSEQEAIIKGFGLAFRFEEGTKHPYVSTTTYFIKTAFENGYFWGMPFGSNKFSALARVFEPYKGPSFKYTTTHAFTRSPDLLNDRFQRQDYYLVTIVMVCYAIFSEYKHMDEYFRSRLLSTPVNMSFAACILGLKCRHNKKYHANLKNRSFNVGQNAAYKGDDKLPSIDELRRRLKSAVDSWINRGAHVKGRHLSSEDALAELYESSNNQVVSEDSSTTSQREGSFSEDEGSIGLHPEGSRNDQLNGDSSRGEDQDRPQQFSDTDEDQDQAKQFSNKFEQILHELFDNKAITKTGTIERVELNRLATRSGEKRFKFSLMDNNNAMVVRIAASLHDAVTDEFRQEITDLYLSDDAQFCIGVGGQDGRYVRCFVKGDVPDKVSKNESYLMPSMQIRKGSNANHYKAFKALPPEARLLDVASHAAQRICDALYGEGFKICINQGTATASNVKTDPGYNWHTDGNWSNHRNNDQDEYTAPNGAKLPPVGRTTNNHLGHS